MQFAGMTCGMVRIDRNVICVRRHQWRPSCNHDVMHDTIVHISRMAAMTRMQFAGMIYGMVGTDRSFNYDVMYDVMNTRWPSLMTSHANQAPIGPNHATNHPCKLHANECSHS